MIRAGKMFIGQSAQLAVMSELVFRGYNVATPAVDVGDDILICSPNGPAQYRVQVKTRTGRKLFRFPGRNAIFSFPAKQLQTAWKPELHYVFTIRIGPAWESVIISRKELLAIFRKRNRSLSHPTTLSMDLSFHTDRVIGMRHDFQPYRNNWSRYWPDLIHVKDSVTHPEGVSQRSPGSRAQRAHPGSDRVPTASTLKGLHKGTRRQSPIL